MLHTGHPSDYTPLSSYKDYKNRTTQKHIDKTYKQLWAIKECSLKPEDKEKARQKILQTITDFKF